MRIIGYRYLSFKPQGSNDLVSGYRCSFMEAYSGPDSVGYAVSTEFLSVPKFQEFGLAEKLKSEQEFKVFYNRYGKIQEII